MLSYVYDGSYDGLLCAIHEALSTNLEPEEFLQEFPAIPNLFCQLIEIKTNPTTAKQMEEFIRESMGKNTVEHLYYTSLSDYKNAPFLLYQYIKQGLTLQKNLNRDLANPIVRQVHRLSRQVTGERHRLLGLARFHKLPSGIYYSKITPDHRVLALMAPHFASRLAQDRWILHDIKREWAVFGDHGHYQLAPLVKDAVKLPEEEMDRLWQQYFAHIAITERENPRCQANFMPRRYWQNLTEKPGQAKGIQKANNSNDAKNKH